LGGGKYEGGHTSQPQRVCIDLGKKGGSISQEKSRKKFCLKEKATFKRVSELPGTDLSFYTAKKKKRSLREGKKKKGQIVELLQLPCRRNKILSHKKKREKVGRGNRPRKGKKALITSREGTEKMPVAIRRTSTKKQSDEWKVARAEEREKTLL